MDALILVLEREIKNIGLGEKIAEASSLSPDAKLDYYQNTLNEKIINDLTHFLFKCVLEQYTIEELLVFSLVPDSRQVKERELVKRELRDMINDERISSFNINVLAEDEVWLKYVDDKKYRFDWLIFAGSAGLRVRGLILRTCSFIHSYLPDFVTRYFFPPRG